MGKIVLEAFMRIGDSRSYLNWQQVPSKDFRESRDGPAMEGPSDKYEPRESSAEDIYQKLKLKADIAAVGAGIGVAVGGLGVVGCLVGGPVTTAGIGLGLAGVGMLCYGVSKITWEGPDAD